MQGEVGAGGQPSRCLQQHPDCGRLPADCWQELVLEPRSQGGEIDDQACVAPKGPFTCLEERQQQADQETGGDWGSYASRWRVLSRCDGDLVSRILVMLASACRRLNTRTEHHLAIWVAPAAASDFHKAGAAGSSWPDQSVRTGCCVTIKVVRGQNRTGEGRAYSQWYCVLRSAGAGAGAPAEPNAIVWRRATQVIRRRPGAASNAGRLSLANGRRARCRPRRLPWYVHVYGTRSGCGRGPPADLSPAGPGPGPKAGSESPGVTHLLSSCSRSRG